MPLNPSDGAKAYVKDFKKSKAPQFKGKSDKKKQQMAIAAYLDDKDDQKESTMQTFKTHMMYDPKTGKGYEAKTKLDHLRMKKMGYSHDKPEPVEEAKSGTGYELYHKDFSSAMQHAYKHAKDKLKIEIDPEEIDKKVASGPRKPSSGKTNSYRLTDKSGKKGVQIQVANLDNKRYELNMYKESLDAAVELDETKNTRKLMKNKSIVDYVRKQQEKNRKAVAKPGGHIKVGAYGNEPRFDSGNDFMHMVADAIKLSSMSLSKRKQFDPEAEYEAIARKLGLHKFEPKLEETLDEGTLYENKSLKTLVSMGMLSKPNMAKVDRAMRGLKDPDGKALVSLVDGLVKVLSGGEMKEAVELDENKSLIKDYEKYMSQGNKKDSNAIDYLMSMPKYKRMSKDQMAKAIGDHKRKGIFKEAVELDEGSAQILAHGGKGQYKVVKKGDVVDVVYKGKVVGKGDFDRGADAFFVSMKGEKGQKSFDDAQAIADYFAKKKIKEDLNEAFSPKEIKMAIGMAADPRFGNNMTGAVKAIEKLKKGLSSHKQVAAVLKRKNENTNGAVTPFRDYT